MLLTWVLIGLAVSAIAVITVSVVITSWVIKEILNSGDTGLSNPVSAKIESKLKDGNHTKIKVKFKDIYGNTSTREIRSDQGADVYTGQTIYK